MPEEQTQGAGSSANCDSEKNSTTATKGILSTYASIAKQSAATLLKDTSCLQFLVYVLDDADSDVRKSALRILLLLARANSGALVDTYGLKNALDLLERTYSNDPDTSRLVKKLQVLLAVGETSRGKLPSLAEERPKQPPVTFRSCKPTQLTPKRHAGPKFISAANRARNIVFQFDCPLDEDCHTTLEKRLLQLKGVVSVYFDKIRHRYTIRARNELATETVADVILESSKQDRINHVVSDPITGVEDLLPISLEHADDARDGLSGKVTTMPDYLDESFGNEHPPSPHTAAHTLVSTGNAKNGGKGDSGWLGGVASFLANSFYW